MIADAFSLKGQTAVVAGAGSVGDGIGIGRAAAVLLAAAGASVGLIDISREAAEKTLRMIEDRGGQGHVIVADLSDDHQVASGIDAIVTRFGSIDILVNNVGVVGPPGTVEDVDLAAWEASMKINVSSMVITARHIVPHMKRAGGGSIVNVSSIAGMGGGYPAIFYPTSKGAVISLTKAMAAHHGPDGIRVNAVAPGQLFTPRISLRGVSDEMRENRAKVSVLGTEGTGWDAGYAILYLASGASRWITGIVLPVDAGMTAILPLQSPRA